MLTFEPGGQIKLYNGSYMDYFQNLTLENETQAPSKSQSGAEEYKLQKERNRKLKLTYDEQKEYDTIEDDIAAIEEKIEKLEKEISNPAYASDFVKLNELSNLKTEAENALEEKMERYMYLDDLVTKIANQ